MKNTLLSVWLAGACAMQAWAQGQIGFGNLVSVAGIDAPVFDTDCVTPLAGAAYLAQVYAGRTPDSLSPVGWVMPFRTGEKAGYISGVAITIPGSFTDLVYTQLRAWEAAAGATFEEAVAAGGKYGVSNIVPMWTVMPPGTPNMPVGLQSFCLVAEPGTGALLALGGMALLALTPRRRNQTRRPAPGVDRPGQQRQQPSALQALARGASSRTGACVWSAPMRRRCGPAASRRKAVSFALPV